VQGVSELELVADYSCVVGEGPLWHPIEQCVYWIDIADGRLFRYEPATGTHALVYGPGEPIGGFTIQEDGALLLFMARGAIRLWRQGVVETLIDELPAERHTRFNDVVADPLGGVFCGTMATPDRPGRLYRIDPDGSLRVILNRVGIPNGMDFSPDLRTFYFTDSTDRTIYAFDYDGMTGSVSNQRALIVIPEGEGVPDGLTVDTKGCLWSARWNGGAVYRYSPTGELLSRFSLPARKVSSVTFGGAGYSDLYITTAGGDRKETEGWGAGGLFRLRAPVLGRAPFLSRITTVQL
jgi:D-xylonolactonase